MNRNATIGVVLVGVLLAAISVGIATYMSKGTIDESAEVLRTEMAAATSDVDSQIATIEDNTVAKENGEAVSLAAVDTLWSKGRLTVTDASGTGLPLFEVDPEASRIVLGANAIEIGDLTAGAMTSTGVVTAEGFQTTAGSWAVDSAGDMRSGDLTVSGDTAVAGILKVNGGELRVGDGFVYDAGARTLAIEGTVFATGIQTSGTANIFTMYNDVQFNADAYSDDQSWKISNDGTAKFGTLAAGAVNAAALTATGAIQGASLNSTGNAAVGGNASVGGTLTVGGLNAVTTNPGAFWVDSAGAVNLTKLYFNGEPFNPKTGRDSDTDVTGNNLTAKNIIASTAFKTASGTFEVVDGSGDTTIDGTLQVGGGAGGAVPANSAEFWVDSSGAANVTDLYIDGVRFDPDSPTSNNITAMGWIKAGSYITATGNITGANLVSTGTLNVGGGDFTVDAAGNTYVAGTLQVAGALSAASATITGDLSATNITASGTISAANLPDGMAAGVDLGNGAGITVTGMPSGAVAVVTPVAPTAAPVFVDTATAGTLNILGDPAVLYNWIVVW